MTTIYCAVCGRRFEPDTDHVRVDAEYMQLQDYNETDEYVLHLTCWTRLTEGWEEPV